jgi:hypothetical protein
MPWQTIELDTESESYQKLEQLAQSDNKLPNDIGGVISVLTQIQMMEFQEIAEEEDRELAQVALEQIHPDLND